MNIYNGSDHTRGVECLSTRFPELFNNEGAIALGGFKDNTAMTSALVAELAVGGPNQDVILNHAFSRLTNLSAEETLKVQVKRTWCP